MKRQNSRDIIGSAVLEHLRNWLGGDGLLHRQIVNSGKTDPKTLRKITNAYGVSRGFLRGKEEQIARLIDDRIDDWPSTLPEKARFAHDLAREAKEDALTRGVQVSGFSKILWFIKPEAWTPYDSFAARGLANHQKRLGFQPFYLRLKELDFVGTTRSMREAVDDAGFPFLWPERIVDKYLMLCGHDPKKGMTVVRTDDHKYILELYGQFFDCNFMQKVEKLIENTIEAADGKTLFGIHRY